MGGILMDYLAQMGRKRGVRRFDARVLPGNKPMLNIFHNSGFPVSTEFDGEAYNIQIDLTRGGG
jgi:hypothetical protein